MQLLSRAGIRKQINRSATTGDTIPWFSVRPKFPTAVRGGSASRELEFKEMVRAFHHADLEVILDVVFNHTAGGRRD